MADAGETRGVAVVAGDVTMDWHLARARRADGGTPVWKADEQTRVFLQPGGAALVGEIITAVARGLREEDVDFEIRRPKPVRPVRIDDPRYHHSFAIWAPFDYDDRSRGRDPSTWRVEEFLGLHRASEGRRRRAKTSDPGEADVIVLDDAGLGFRNNRESWPAALNNSRKRPWVLLKMARPVADGDLWTFLHANLADRLIVVITVNDLRLTEAQISRELSWERTAQDLAWELVHNPHINGLSDCAHVIVSFDTAGALLLSRTGDGESQSKCRLFFDPEVVEGMWSPRHPGGIIGYTSCLTASLARYLMLPPARRDLHESIREGLTAMRRLLQEGYGKEKRGNVPSRLAFPTQAVVSGISSSGADFAEVDVPDPARFLTARGNDVNGRAWTILEDVCLLGHEDNPKEALDSVAEGIVRRGAGATLEDVPLGRFGKLLTLDRREIESLRSIRTLISEYCKEERPERPLSIAVFGPPGAGKSFGIAQVAGAILPDLMEKLTFNLSQFSDPSELLGALHQVRDKVLSGKVPLVFWDEFDTTLDGQALGWLRYFLSPMQDGKFQERQLTHSIGRAIFVFAGGTSPTLEMFGKDPDIDVKAVKGPDFVSRLKGYINILGPNPVGGDPGSDPFFVIRRAILLRSFLENSALNLFRPPERNGELQIDSGVLRAFLRIEKYEHGARSMESIIAMSVLKEHSRFERSSLPAESQLDLHVNGRAFLALVQQITMDDRVLERLAEAAHNVYCRGLEKRGESTPISQLSYSQLPEHEREQNRDNVRDIPRKIEMAGYVMIPARSNEPPFDFPGPDMETLARAEHERWMRFKLKAGWKYGDPTDKEARLHQALLPWETMSEDERIREYGSADSVGPTVLPEEEKDKDRDLIRGIPEILAEAGYTIVQVRTREGDEHERKWPQTG